MNGITLRKEETYKGQISNVVVEQEGPVRCVIRMEGKHHSSAGDGEILPFILRWYFYKGLSSLRIVHTFVFDGKQQSDFIKGLGISFSAPMSGAMYNRHVRFVGDTGIFAEPAQSLSTRAYRNIDGLYEQQIAGQLLNIQTEKYTRFLQHVEDGAVWDSYKLVQNSADHYQIEKRTGPACCWIECAHGQRSGGLMFVGDETGGLTVGLKDVWRKYPSALEVHHISAAEAKLTTWLWSPDGPAMDLRHYDTTTHVDSAYEGFEEMRATAEGIANTSEITLWCASGIPERTELLEQSAQTQFPSMLVCEPEYYHQTNVFGVWSLRDTSTPHKAWLENQLDAAIDFYKNEIEQRRWYGFWNYGDVMHTYDPVRHTWRYDMGGFAWQNTELVPNMWLWYVFLRTGRADIFRMAEAMTRHTSEVDMYHLGEYAGLGSRHNVVHWGCGCKEARISMAGLHRFYYYLTGDERIGEILDEVKDADAATKNLDPMRALVPKDDFPTHTRSGPDWSAFCSNWMTAWERSADESYRGKIQTGIDCFKQMPFGLCSGPTFGYDPQTSKLFHMDDGGDQSYHMVIAFGAPEVWMELVDLLQDPAWEEMIIDFGKFFALNDEEKRARTSGKIGDKNWHWPMFYARLVAYAAAKSGDRALAKKAWALLLHDELNTLRLPIECVPVRDAEWIKPMTEIPWVTTNTVSQWSLNVIECLALIDEYLPEAFSAIAGVGEKQLS